MFSGASNVDSCASGKEVVSIKLQSVSSTRGPQAEDADEPKENNLQSKGSVDFKVLDQQIPDLVTLSLLPRSQWQSLINLDIIKVFPVARHMFRLSSPVDLASDLPVKNVFVSLSCSPTSRSGINQLNHQRNLKRLHSFCLQFHLFLVKLCSNPVSQPTRR